MVLISECHVIFLTVAMSSCPATDPAHDVDGAQWSEPQPTGSAPITPGQPAPHAVTTTSPYTR